MLHFFSKDKNGSSQLPFKTNKLKLPFETKFGSGSKLQVENNKIGTRLYDEKEKGRPQI